MRLSTVLAGALIAFFAMALPAHADKINGELTMAGILKPTGGAGIDLSDATGIDFDPNTFIALQATEDLGAYISFMDVGAIKDFTFDPFGAPIEKFWEIQGFSFELKAISVKTQNAAFLNLVGTGILSGNGFDDTVAGWNFSTQLVQGGKIFSFSAHAVPEPASLALLGIAGLVVSRRRKRAA